MSIKRRADEIAHSWPGQCFWSFGRGKSAGVALFVSPKFSGRISRFLFDSNGRVLSALVLLGPISLNMLTSMLQTLSWSVKPFLSVYMIILFLIILALLLVTLIVLITN